MSHKLFFVLMLLFWVGVAVAPAGTLLAGHPCNDPKYPVAVHESSGASVCKAAESGGTITTIGDLIDRVAAVLNTLVPFIIGLAVFVILWGVFGYISHAGEEEKRQEARQFVVWGIIGIFFMLSIWGFVNILDQSFNLNKDAPPRSELPSLPCIPIPPATTC